MADFVVSLTRKGRELEAQQLLYGYGFQITYFSIGAGGHDPGNPSLALPLDLDVTELPSQFFGPEPIDKAELTSPTCPRFTCILQPGEAVGGISNLGLIAVVKYVPISSLTIYPTDINTTTSVITKTDHGLASGNEIVFTTLGTMPSPLIDGNPYYVVNATTNNFQLASTSGGTPISITTQGTVVHFVTNNDSLPPNAPAVGSQFLYALTNFPLRTKLSASRETYYVSLKT